MSKIETLYLDKEIEEIENYIEYVGTISYDGIKETRQRLQEYQSIKEALKRLGELEEFVSDLQDDLTGLNTLEIGDRLKTVLEK